jgi:hypothetical protein
VFVPKTKTENKTARNRIPIVTQSVVFVFIFYD